MTDSHLSNLPGLQSASVTKLYRHGTHRVRTPEQTLEWITPHLPAMGITRVADITGLDRIGIPVIMVVRANSRALAVSQGKGLTLISARVSGIMESVETYHAERIVQPLKLTSQSILSHHEQVANIERLPKSRECTYHAEDRLLWIQGVNLLNGEPTWLPYEAVHTDFTLPRPAGSGYFPANTNGLASGNHLLEAQLHALFEVVERDSLALLHQRQSTADDVIDLNSVEDDNCLQLLNTLSDSNMQVKIWNATSDTGIACFECLLIGRDDQHADPEFGSGCHSNSQVAMLRALTEAVQARTTFIAGSRDDYGAAPYTRKARADRLAVCRQMMNEDTGQMTSFASVPDQSFDSVSADLDWSLDQLKAIGIDEVLSVDLTLKEFGIPVVRMVVPGLEGAYKGASSDYVPGERAQRVLQA